MWIEFGRINNLKCVDYFRVTYTKSDKTGVTTITTDPIDRLEKGALMTVVPCTLYTFRVAAYEEFHGTGRRFKMLSNEVNSTLNYTVLYCTVLHRIVLYCTVLYCTLYCPGELHAGLHAQVRKEADSLGEEGVSALQRPPEAAAVAGEKGHLPG